MRFDPTELGSVIEVSLDRREDDRGWFARAWCTDEFREAGLEVDFVQANLAHNPKRSTLRGMHFQQGLHGEIKFVRCTRGRVYDVAVDIRSTSATFCQWVARELSAELGNGLVIPQGFAHGYLTMEADSDLLYMTSHRYIPEASSGVRYDDPAFGISWPAPPLLVSNQDRRWPLQSERIDL